MWRLTAQFADKPTCCQSCHGLINSQTSQLADNEVFKKLRKTIKFFILHLTITLIQTLLNGDSEQIGAFIYSKFSSEHFDKLISLRLDRPRVSLLANCQLASGSLQCHFIYGEKVPPPKQGVVVGRVGE